MLGYLSPIFAWACLVSIVAEFLTAVDDQHRIIILAGMLVLAQSGTEPVFYLCLDKKPLIIQEVQEIWWQNLEQNVTFFPYSEREKNKNRLKNYIRYP